MHFIPDLFGSVPANACDDGAVIAADRQVSHGVLGQITVGQPGTKVDVIAGAALYGPSGQVNKGQQLCSVIRAEQPRFASTPVDDAVQKLQTGFRAVLNPAFATAQQAKNIVGPQLAFMDVLCLGLLAPGSRREFDTPAWTLLGRRLPLQAHCLTRL